MRRRTPARPRPPPAFALASLALPAPPLAARHHTTNPFRSLYGWGRLMGFSGAEGVVLDRDGSVYGAEVSRRRIAKWVRFRR